MSRGSASASLGGGIVAALVLSVGGAALLAALAPWLGAETAARAVAALLGAAYVGWVLACSRERVGRTSVAAAWLAAAALLWAAAPPLALYVVVHAAMAALVRSLYRRAGLVAALADLALTALGLAFAAFALARSGSALLALWCFFLTLALHAELPSAGPSSSGAPARRDRGAERFERARRAADEAVRRLAAGAR
jgi:hypothetical protein